MLVYRENLSAPLSAEQVDNNFKFLYFMGNISFDMGVRFGKSAASLMLLDYDYIPVGTHQIGEASNTEVFKCFKIEAGNYIYKELSEVTESYLCNFEGFSLDYLDIDFLTGQSPLPYDCYFIVSVSGQSDSIRISTAPISVN